MLILKLLADAAVGVSAASFSAALANATRAAPTSAASGAAVARRQRRHRVMRAARMPVVHLHALGLRCISKPLKLKL